MNRIVDRIVDPPKNELYDQGNRSYSKCFGKISDRNLYMYYYFFLTDIVGAANDYNFREVDLPLGLYSSKSELSREKY